MSVTAPAKSFAKQMRPSHLAVVKDLGYVLTLGTSDAWLGFSVLLRAELDERERAALAYAAMRALDPDNAARVGEEFAPAGPPLPVLFDPVEDAVWWADLATPDERRAYCLATFMSMPPRDQADFLTYVQREAAA